jgi:hypothetical protein
MPKCTTEVTELEQLDRWKGVNLQEAVECQTRADRTQHRPPPRRAAAGDPAGDLRLQGATHRPAEDLFFNAERICQDELKKLSDLGLVEREELTAQIGTGRAQPLWSLTETGVRVVAVMARKPRSQLKWMPRHAWHDSNALRAH